MTVKEGAKAQIHWPQDAWNCKSELARFVLGEWQT